MFLFFSEKIWFRRIRRPSCLIMAFITALMLFLSGVTIVKAETVTATVVVGCAPGVVAVNPVTNKIYVANGTDNSVTVIDGATNSTTTVVVGSYPIAVAVNPATNKIYVANRYGNSVTVIDGATNSTTTVAVGWAPVAVAVNPVTNKIYVANQSGDNVTVIDGATNSTATVAVGESPDAVAVNPATNKIYVANYGSNSVTVIDGATGSTATVTVGDHPSAVAVNPATNKIYVANFGSDNVTVIDGATNNATTVSVGDDPCAVAVNPATNKIYVANYQSNSLTVIDGTTGSTATMPAVTSPIAVAVNPVTNKIYVTNGVINIVTVIDGATSITITVAAGNDPHYVAVNPATNKIYVVNYRSNSVTVIDGASNSTTTVAAGANPCAVAVNPVTNKIYVTNQSSDKVTVIDERSEQDVNPAVAIAPLPGNATTDTTPSIEFTASSDSPLQVRQIWYQTDTLNGQWQKAESEGSSACATIPALSLGTHILYAMATDGQDASSVNTGSGSSPMIGKTAAYAFTVISPPAIVSSGLPDGMLQRLYDSTLSAVHGMAPYTWNASGLPGGMYLNTVTGEVYGYPETTGSFTPSFTVSDTLGNSSSRSISMNISSAPDGSGCLSAIPATATAGGAVNSIDFTYAPSEGGMYDGTVIIEIPGGWTMPSTVPGSPGYVTADCGDVTVSGQTITVTGVFFHEGDSLGVTYSNASAPAAGKYSFNAKAKTTAGGDLTNLAPDSLPSITLGADSTAPVWPEGAVLSASDKSLNALTLNWPQAADDTGVSNYRIYKDDNLVSTVAGSVYGCSVAGLTQGLSYSFSVKAYDCAGNASSELTLTASTNSALTIDTSGITAATAGSPYCAFPVASGGTAPYTWSAAGLPAGLSLDASTGALTGTPDVVGTWMVNLSLSDSLGNTTSKGITLFVFYPAGTGRYIVSPSSDAVYTAGATSEGITTMTVNNGVTGFKYFTVNIATVQSHSGNEVAVFVQMRNGVQIAINATKTDYDRVNSAIAAFNVYPGDIIKVYIVDDLTNDVGFNPTLLQ